MSQISCSYSFQALDLGAGACTTPVIFRTNLTAVHTYKQVLIERRSVLPAKLMFSCGLSLSTLCSMQFVTVNRNNVKDVVSVRRVVWAVNDVALYRV